MPFKNFDEILSNIKRLTGTRNQKEVASFLGISGSAITDAKKRNVIPETWFQTIEKKCGVTKEELCRPPERVQVRSQVDISYGDASPQEEEGRFNQELDSLFMMVKRWQAEENGPDSLTSMQFVKLFHERIPELAAWIKKRKGGDNQSTVPEQLSVNDNK
jgi:hypothetical protein